MNKTKYNNKIKEQKLKMPLGTASGILRKAIMFNLAIKLNLDNCHRCSKKIRTVDEFSIEHKIDWQNSDSPIKNFFDVENIAFSHLSCNCSHGRKSKKHSIFGKSGYKGVCYVNEKRSKRWRATIIDKSGKRKDCGYFMTSSEAAAAYDVEAIRIYGGNAITNKKIKFL